MLIASHIGTNKETGNQMNSGELRLNWSQGTLLKESGRVVSGELTPMDWALVGGKTIIEADGKNIFWKPLTI